MWLLFEFYLSTDIDNIKKQGYGDPGHGEDKPQCHPAKQPLY